MDSCLPGECSVTWVAAGHPEENVYARRAQETFLPPSDDHEGHDCPAIGGAGGAGAYSADQNALGCNVDRFIE